MPLVRTKPTWEEQVTARIEKRAYRSYFPSEALEEATAILQEEWDVADYWSAIGDDKERLVNAGKMQGLDYAINVLELVFPLIDAWIGERNAGDGASN